MFLVFLFWEVTPVPVWDSILIGFIANTLTYGIGQAIISLIMLIVPVAVVSLAVGIYSSIALGDLSKYRNKVIATRYLRTAVFWTLGLTAISLPFAIYHFLFWLTTFPFFPILPTSAIIFLAGLSLISDMLTVALVLIATR